MFFGIRLDTDIDLQHLVLTLNTVLLIAILIVVELLYAEAPKNKRRHLRLFFPLIAVLGGLLIYAVYKQMGEG